MLQFFGKRLQEMQEVKRDERGFTLIELLVVVIIIGVLAAIAIPVFLNQREKAQVATVKSDVRNAVTMDTAMKTEGDSGLAPGTYTEGQQIGTGANSFRVSDGVSLEVTTGGASIVGTYPGGPSGSWTYTFGTGAYVGAGDFQ